MRFGFLLSLTHSEKPTRLQGEKDAVDLGRMLLLLTNPVMLASFFRSVCSFIS